MRTGPLMSLPPFEPEPPTILLIHQSLAIPSTLSFVLHAVPFPSILTATTINAMIHHWCINDVLGQWLSTAHPIPMIDWYINNLVPTLTAVWSWYITDELFVRNKCSPPHGLMIDWCCLPRSHYTAGFIHASTLPYYNFGSNINDTPRTMVPAANHWYIINMWSQTLMDPPSAGIVHALLRCALPHHNFKSTVNLSPAVIQNHRYSIYSWIANHPQASLNHISIIHYQNSHWHFPCHCVAPQMPAPGLLIHISSRHMPSIQVEAPNDPESMEIYTNPMDIAYVAPNLPHFDTSVIHEKQIARACPIRWYVWFRVVIQFKMLPLASEVLLWLMI